MALVNTPRHNGKRKCDCAYVDVNTSMELKLKHRSRSRRTILPKGTNPCIMSNLNKACLLRGQTHDKRPRTHRTVRACASAPCNDAPELTHIIYIYIYSYTPYHKVCGALEVARLPLAHA